ncbi:MAG: hypothetical protein EBY17_29775, partial [Acidobacteriia bacterium]|nr:hypothetical protein [Terriglobia bacterium]
MFHGSSKQKLQCELNNSRVGSVGHLAEIAVTQRGPGFVPALLASVKRLVDFDFVMVFAYAGTARPL